MSVRRGLLGFGKFAVWFVAMGLSVASCTSVREGDDDEGDDDGSGSVVSQCAVFCERLATCGSTAYCLEDCESGAADANALGCGTYYRRVLDCAATVPDICALDACSAQIETLSECASGGTPADCAPTGTARPSSNCTALCEKVQLCAGAEPTDCPASCAESALAVEEYGCTSEYNAYIGCLSTCSNICAQTGDECFLEYDAFVACFG